MRLSFKKCHAHKLGGKRIEHKLVFTHAEKHLRNDNVDKQHLNKLFTKYTK